MSTTLQLVREEMLTGHVEELGEVLGTPTSLTVTTAVFAKYATGGVLAEKYKNKWFLRPDAASAADRERRIYNFTTASGAFDFTGGANFADTTVTDESCLALGFRPILYDQDRKSVV